jgi:hypothetical protein
MTPVLEAWFVGLYSLAVYLAVIAVFGATAHGASLFPNTLYPLILFITGFLKHGLGHFLLHTYYCNHGYACTASLPPGPPRQASVPLPQLLIECVLEGLAFVALGYVEVAPRHVQVFFIGVGLHMVCEWVGVHAVFCGGYQDGGYQDGGYQGRLGHCVALRPRSPIAPS